MRNDGLTILALTALAAAQALGASTGAPVDGVRVDASTSTPRVVSGAQIVVTGTMTNERNQKIALATTDPLGGFRITIRNAKGHVVSMNASGRDLVKLVHRSKQQLAPGEKIEQSIWVSSLYNLKKPGKYTVTLTHDVAASSGAFMETVKSNAVLVVVKAK